MRRRYHETPKDIPGHILGKFAEEFGYATNIRWTHKEPEGVYRARFKSMLDTMEAYFDKKGNCFNVLHYLSSIEQLSADARKVLGLKFPDYRVMPVYECFNRLGTDYTVLALGMEDTLQLQISINGELKFFIRTSVMKQC